MRLILHTSNADGSTRRLEPPPPVSVLGADASADLALDDPSISSQHAKLIRDADGTWWVEDLQSTNGTYLNGEEVPERKKLQSGDELEFGLLKTRVELQPIEEAESPPKAAPTSNTGKTAGKTPSARPKKTGATQTWKQAEFYIDLLFLVCGWIHERLAKYLPIAISWVVRMQAKLPMQLRFMLGFLLLAGISAWVGWLAIPSYLEWTDFSEEHLEILRDHRMIRQGDQVATLGQLTAYALLAVAALAWLRHKFTLVIFKAGLALFLLLWLYLFNFYTGVPAILNHVDYKYFDNFYRNEYWLRGWMPWLPALFPAALLMLGVALRPVWNFYGKTGETSRLPGDQVVESLRTGGHDPRMRSSSYWATFLCLFALALPFIMRGCGWEDPYGLPKGSGDPVVEMVQVTRQREIPERRLIVNNWSPFIFERMEIDDIKILDEMEEQTLDTYEIAQEQTGKLGEGGGDTGGWPEGMEGATVRFIRLQYSGGDWDQNMDRNSDANLLRRFNRITGFPVAPDGEARRADRLRRFPQGLKPPFVFMTGRGNVNFSANEIRTLRWYTLEEGGMIFATHGGGNFDRNFRNQLNRIFPGSRLVDIPNDDPIYRAPFVFPNGAPPLWQQAGSRSLGIRHEGRWVVFYHPGDMSDAWRDGHSGASPEVAEQAYRMAINVMYYAFNMYYARHHR